MFQGNERLRAEGELVTYTKELIQEYIRCKEDIIYFAEKYFYITTIDDGKIKIPLWEFQKKVLKAFIKPPKNRRHIIMMMPRQQGKTTISTVYLLHYMLFNKDKNVAILANKKDTALEIMQRVKMAFESLPTWLQQGIKEGGWNKSSIRLENGMVMKASTTSSDSISGDTVSLLYMDEFAKVKSHIAEEFITATYPVISSGKTSKIIMVSTPLGMNHFYEFWVKARRGIKGDLKNGNNFYPIKVRWQDHPKRDQEWKDEIIRDIGPTRFNQEYGCVEFGSYINIRDKNTGEIEKIKIGDFYNRLK